MFNYGNHLEKLDFPTTYLYILDGINWNIVPLLQEPIAVNYTVDESFDNALISFLSNEIITKLENGTIVLLSYENITPDFVNKNYDVFVITKGEMTFKNGWGFHSYYLDELISLTKHMPLETLTFTSDTRVEITTGDGSVVYKQEPYNAMTILTRILARPTRALNYNNSYDKDILLANDNWLKTELIGVDDNFKDNTLYDALIKIGNYLDRLPILEFNFDYDGTNEKYILRFIKKTTANKYDLRTYITRANDIVYSDESSLGKSVVASVENMIGSKINYFPSKNQYAFAASKNDEDLNKNNSSELRLILPNPISEIKKLTQLKLIIRYKTKDGEIDLPDFDTYHSSDKTYTEIKVLEYREWLVQYDRENCAFYKENESEIFFGNNIKNNQNYSVGALYQHTAYLFNVEYYALNNPLIQKGQGLGEYFNQVDNMVDGGSFGRQLENYQKANSGGDLTFSVVESAFSDILKVGDKLDDYIISKLSFNTFKNNGATNYKVAYTLNKEVARRNHFIKSNDGIRNYQTYYQGVEERKINLKEEVKVWVKWGLGVENPLNNFKFIENRDLVFGGFLSDEISLPIPMIETAVLLLQSQVTKENNVVENFFLPVQTNMTKSLVGESVLLNIKLQDNTKAGVILGKIQTGANATQVQLPLIYTNPFGRVDELDIEIYGFKDLQEIFRLFITTPTGVKNIEVKRNGIVLNDRELIYNGDVLTITAQAVTGYLNPTITTPYTVVKSINTSELIIGGAVIEKKVTFVSLQVAYEIIEVKRTASALKDASLGILESGDAIYYGDTLQITAVANQGYKSPSYNPIVNVYDENINVNSLITAGGIAEYTLTIDSITGVKNIKAYTQVEVMGGMTWLQIQNGATITHWNYIFFTAEAEAGYNPPTITGSEMFPIQITGNIVASDYIKAGKKPVWVLSSGSYDTFIIWRVSGYESATATKNYLNSVEPPQNYSLGHKIQVRLYIDAYEQIDNFVFIRGEE